MSSTPALDEVAQLPNDIVELVPSARGRNKAKYAGRTYTLHSTNGTRYRWVCGLRTCKSRLTTDLFGDQHLVYHYQPHSEELHRLAERTKRRSRAIDNQQSLKRIKDCDYVLEKQEGSTQFWRCALVKCPGRCRTSRDGMLVAGPTNHATEVHRKGSTNPQDVGPSTSVELEHLEDGLPDVRQGTEGTSRAALLLQSQEMQEKQRGEEDKRTPYPEEDQTCKPSIVVKLVIKSKQSSGVKWDPNTSSPSPAATTDNICHKDSSEHAADARGQDVGGFIDTHPAVPVITQEESNGAVRDADRVVIPSSEDDDVDEAEDKVSHSSTHSQCGDASDDDKSTQLEADCAEKDGDDANDLPSYKSADSVVRGRSHTPVGGYEGRREEALETTRDSGELGLRASVLVQMRRLLEAETQLANQRRQVEILRESILERQLKNLVPLTVPSKPNK